MFEHLRQNEFSHMPFVGLSLDGNDKELCCLKRNDKWKVHYLDNGIYRKLATYTNEDATECGPTAEWNPLENNWRISFIAGGSEANDWEDTGFYLYLKRGFDDSAPVKICPANVGYIWKHQINFGYKIAPIIYQIEDGVEKKITLKDIDYVYRLSYDVSHPDNMLISAQRINGEIVSFSYRPEDDNLYVYEDGGIPCYKMCFGPDEEVYYALKNQNGDFEERHIVKAGNIKKTRYSRKMFIKSIDYKETDYVTENFGEI